MREIKSITGLRVIAVDEGANVGTVSQVVVDLASGEMLGVIVGNGAAERGVMAADIQTVGSDVIMISRREVARPLSELPELEKRRTAGGHLVPVFTDKGRRLGVISGIFIDPCEKVVTRYEVSSGAIKDLAEGLLVLPVVAGTVHGQDAVILPEAAVGTQGRETGGLLARFSQWGESARKQYQQVADSAEKLVETSGETLKKEAAAASETLKKEAAAARERAAEVAGGLSARAEDLSSKAKQAVTRLGLKDEAPADADDRPADADDRPAEEPAPSCCCEETPAEEPAPSCCCEETPAEEPAPSCCCEETSAEEPAPSCCCEQAPAEEAPASDDAPAADDERRES